MDEFECTLVELANGSEEYWCCPTGAGIMEVAGVPFELGCIRLSKEDFGGI
jgi:hypothetical protein